MSHTLEHTLLRQAFYQPRAAPPRSSPADNPRRERVRSIAMTLMCNALLFLGDHHQTPRQNPQCQKGGEEEADDEREDPREGTLPR